MNNLLPIDTAMGGVHEFVEQMAASFPSCIAVHDGQQQYSYERLNCAANQLARYISEKSSGPVNVVAISFERSFDQLVSVLAVMKAGAACLAIDSTYPTERIRYMLSIASADILVTTEATAAAFSDIAVQNVWVDRERSAIDKQPSSNVAPIKGCYLPSYVVFTSGSTGTPKGVVMPHRALLNLAVWHRDSGDAPGIMQGIRKAPPTTLQFAPMTFDVSFEELFTTWAEGGTVVLINELLRLDPDSLLEYIRSQNITRLFLPVAALMQIAEAIASGIQPPHSLNEVITAGEALVITPVVSAFFNAIPNCELYNEYGPSETHVVTSYRLHGPPNTWPLYPPIGSAITQTTVYLVDHNGSTVPDGTEGELWLAGDCLADGYIGRPDLTSERFVYVPEPNGSGLIVRVYKTGDLVKRDSVGALIFIGRTDQQIKIRGYRVEPAEIEQALRKSSGLETVAVVARRYESGDTVLLAFLQRGQQNPISPSVLRAQMKLLLPDYMLPAQYRFLSEFPLTSSGKIDRKSLARLDDENVHEILPSAGLEQSPEEVVAKHWREMLHNPHVGFDDNFFDIGGTSLQAVRLHRKLKEELHTEFPITVLFEYPTVTTLANFLKETGRLLPKSDGSNKPSDNRAPSNTLSRLREFRNRR